MLDTIDRQTRDEYVEVAESPAAPPPRRTGRIDSRRSTVDFSLVPPSQWAMHDRLVNWSRWCHGDSGESARAGGDSPMFRLYRSSDARRAYGEPTAIPINHADARAIASAVAILQFRHRKVLGWYYIEGARNAKGMADEVCLSIHGLAETVIAARGALMLKVGALPQP